MNDVYRLTFGIMATYLVLTVMLILFLKIAVFFSERRQHRDTKYIFPSYGQLWMRGKKAYFIEHITHDGDVVYTIEGHVMQLSWRQWHDLVLSAGLYLYKGDQ